MTRDVLQTFKVKCQRSRSQRKNVVWSPKNRPLLWNRGHWI